MNHTPRWYGGDDLDAPCSCGHSAGEHSAMGPDKCCVKNCPCRLNCRQASASFYLEPQPAEPDIHAKLDFIISWIHRQELKEMERELNN